VTRGVPLFVQAVEPLNDDGRAAARVLAIRTASTRDDARPTFQR
jgi:hypothetical protein